MFDAVGNVFCHSHLRLQMHVCRLRHLLHVCEQSSSVLLMLCTVHVVVHHVDSHDVTMSVCLSHMQRQREQAFRLVLVLHGNEHCSVVAVVVVLPLVAFAVEHQFAHRALCEHGADDTCKEHHQYYSIEHGARHLRLSVSSSYLHAHHDDGNGSCSVCRCESEHHVS